MERNSFFHAPEGNVPIKIRHLIPTTPAYSTNRRTRYNNRSAKYGINQAISLACLLTFAIGSIGFYEEIRTGLKRHRHAPHLTNNIATNAPIRTNALYLPNTNYNSQFEIEPLK